MKKWTYIIGGFILGIVVTISSGTVSAQIQSLIGKKVTSEMNVIVNGNKLQDKGAVIEGRTNAPVRALSEALGADLSVSGDTIIINYSTGESNVNDTQTVDFEGKKYTKDELLEMKQSTEDYLNVTIPQMEEKNKERVETLLDQGMKENAKQFREADEKDITERKATYTERLNKINEALKQFDSQTQE